MRGIILAGGTGSRLWPLTRAVSKQLMPIFDKPMIYYPLATLMSAGINDILIITTSNDQEQFHRLLGSGNGLGINISYEVQMRPGGIAESFLIGADFIGDQSVALILGDNIFHGLNLRAEEIEGGSIFAYPVSNPRDYGVVEFFSTGHVRSIQEKPQQPRSKYAIPGLYFYDNQIISIASSIRPSGRCELEISDVNEEYLRRGQLKATILDRGTVWLDTGTFSSLVAASEYVRVIEERQGMKIGCIEEVAWRKGFIDDGQLARLAKPLKKSGYGQYLMDLLREEK